MKYGSADGVVALSGWMQDMLGDDACICFAGEAPPCGANDFALTFRIDVPTMQLDRLYHLGYRKPEAGSSAGIGTAYIQVTRRSKAVPVQIAQIDAPDLVEYSAGRARRAFTLHCRVGKPQRVVVG